MGEEGLSYLMKIESPKELSDDDSASERSGLTN